MGRGVHERTVAALILDTGPLYASLDRCDADVGFVDTAVLAVVERLGEPKLATLDHQHVGALRPAHVDALRLLPEI